jgi:hypothetical protein
MSYAKDRFKDLMMAPESYPTFYKMMKQQSDSQGKTVNQLMREAYEYYYTDLQCKYPRDKE